MSDAPIQAEIQESVSFLSGSGQQGSKKLGKIVRDSAGRLRIESGIRESTTDSTVTLEFPDGGRFQVPGNYLDATIQIFDRTQFQQIRLGPGRLRADTSPFYSAASGNPDIKLICDSRFQEFKNYDRSDGAVRRTQEVLGTREIEGNECIGVQQTDYRRNGERWEPVREITFWYSNELGLELRRLEKDLQTKMERQVEVVSIDHTEPAISQFEIPAGYRVNPPASETPRVVPGLNSATKR